MPRRLYIQTPLLQSTPLELVISEQRRRKTECWVKMDAMQPAGSFKMRGIGHHAALAVERGAKRLVTSSGGNAGLAVAVAGRKLKVPVDVIVPTTTPANMRKLIQQEGANVEVFGSVWDQANEEAIRRVRALGSHAVLVHPFDHPELWAGHSSLITEVHEQLRSEDPDARPMCIVTVAGGGGLLCGVLQGLSQVGWGDVPVVVCETKGADSLNQSLVQRELITLPAITSIARSLGARKVAPEAFRLAMSRKVISLVVTDDEAINACWTFLEQHRVALEPSCGAGLAAIYNWRALGIDAELERVGYSEGPVIFIACGGNMVLEPRTKL